MTDLWADRKSAEDINKREHDTSHAPEGRFGGKGLDMLKLQHRLQLTVNRMYLSTKRGIMHPTRPLTPVGDLEA